MFGSGSSTSNDMSFVVKKKAEGVILFLFFVFIFSTCSMIHQVGKDVFFHHRFRFTVKSRLDPSDIYFGSGVFHNEPYLYDHPILYFEAFSDGSDEYVYHNHRMKYNDMCLEISPPLPNLHLLNMKILENSRDQVFDRLISTYFQRNVSSESFLTFEYGKEVFLLHLNNGVPTNLISKEFELHFDEFVSYSERHEDKSKFQNIEIPSTLKECRPSKYRFYETTSKQTQEDASVKPWFHSPKTCHFHWLKNSDECLSVNQNQKKYDCVFLPGVGVTPEEAGPVSSSWTYYWGNLNEYMTEQCNSTSFVKEETQYRGWDNHDLQQAYCEALIDLDGSPEGNDNVARNKLIITHSMGSLTLAGAIQNGFCSIDKSSSLVYTLASTSRGSCAASWIEDICTKQHSLEEDVVNYLGYCLNDSALPAYQTLCPDYPGLTDEIRDIIADFADGAMCGDSPWGLTSKASIKMFAVGELAFESGMIDDGMVNLQSCESSNTLYSGEYDELYYLARINHVDQTTQMGDGWFGKDRKPLSYVITKGIS